ncbi:MAG: RES family NAD+ phosphorylase [Pseudodesulfovibrio sp.]
MAPLPSCSDIFVQNTHRLIPTKHLDQDSVLDRIADDKAHLDDIFDLDNATNDRLVAENNLLPGIGLEELVGGTYHYRVVNASFCHASPEGSRFNGPDRGAWYAGLDLDTAIAEILFHKSIEYAEIDYDDVDRVFYADFLANFDCEFHDVRNAPEFVWCLNPDSYAKSQLLARQLLEEGSNGIIYPSVRHKEGECVACFKPALVGNVRRDKELMFQWNGRIKKPTFVVV